MLPPDITEIVALDDDAGAMLSRGDVVSRVSLDGGATLYVLRSRYGAMQILSIGGGKIAPIYEPATGGDGGAEQKGQEGNK